MEKTNLYYQWKKLIKDKEYWVAIFTIGLPVALQNLFSSALNLIDGIMVGQLGDSSLAAVGFANTVFFLMIVFMFGIGSGTAIFIAQYFGKKDYNSVKLSMAIGFVISLIVSLFFMFVTLLAAEPIMQIFSTDQRVISLGVDYLSVVAFSYPLAAVSNLLYSGLRSTKQAYLPLVISVFSIGLNTVGNYLLIYGKAGFPVLGVKGAAIATLLARLLEVVIVLGYIYISKNIVSFHRKHLAGIKAKFFKEIMRVTLPVFLNEGLWALGVSSYALLWGRLGTTYAASFNILQTVNRLTFSLSMGMAAATSALIGHKLGEGNFKKAYSYGARSNFLSVVVGIFFGFFLFLFSPNIVYLFKVSEGARGTAILFLKICAFLVPLMTFNVVNMLGALRGGGDTKFSLIIDILFLWLFAIPLSFLGAFVFHWSLPFIFLATTSDEIFKVLFGVRRFLSKKWLNQMLTPDEINNKDKG